MRAVNIHTCIHHNNFARGLTKARSDLDVASGLLTLLGGSWVKRVQILESKLIHTSCLAFKKLFRKSKAKRWLLLFNQV